MFVLEKSAEKHAWVKRGVIRHVLTSEAKLKYLLSVIRGCTESVQHALIVLHRIV